MSTPVQGSDTKIANDLSRRGFIGAAAAGLAGAALVGFAGCAPRSNKESQGQGASSGQGSFDETYDVVICGAGGTGLAAACAAAKAGVDVMVFEKAPMPGGTTALSGGVIQAAGTKWQKEFTSFQNDTPEIHAACYIKQAEGIADEELIKTLTKRAPELVEWLSTIGLDFTSVYGNCHVPYCDPENLHADRIHVYAGGGAAAGGQILTDAEYAEAQKQGAKFTFNAEVSSLITQEETGVVGIVVSINGREKRIGAKRGVILGLGGIDRNEELARAYNQQQYWDLTTQKSYISPEAKGDGIRMGLEINAALATVGGTIDYDMVTGNATSNALPQMPCVFVNKQGRRFVCEDATYAYTYRAIFQQATQNYSDTWMIMDQNGVEQGLIGAIWPDIEGALAQGDLVSGNTYEELAEALGIPASVFADTMASYNKSVSETGTDVEFGRNTQLIPLNKPPYYAHKNIAANLGSLGGLKITPQAQVVDNQGNPIPHLYAGGMNSGGWYGLYYPGSGTSLSGGLVFGYIAGETAAAADPIA